MSTSTADVSTDAFGRGHAAPEPSAARWYFASDTVRTIQTVLGLLWLLDGGLQFQSFMYGNGFVEFIKAGAQGQPGWLHDSIIWSANLLASNSSVWNTLFALTQVTIGLGILYRPTVKLALIASFGWTLVVWWSGEAFGMLFMTMAAPLTGAPGAVLLYAMTGAIVWPNGRPGGLLGVRGARTAWAVLWLLMAWLWLEAPSSAANAFSGALDAAPSGMSWLSTVQYWVADRTVGDGLWIAIVLAIASAAIGIAVARDWRARPFLALSIALNLAFWVLGQGFGGIFEGGATDPNAGPLFVLMAVAMYPLAGLERRAPRAASSRSAPALAS